MKIITKKWISRSVVFCAAIVLLLSGNLISTKRADAAEKPKLQEDSMTIGYGTMGTLVGLNSDSDVMYSLQPYCITIVNPQKGASYSYTSSNKKVAAVKTVSGKGFLTGKSKGTAVITCKQKLKGKTITIGTCKVTVKAASLVQKSNYKVKDITIQTGKGKQEIFSVPFILLHRNNKAKYTYVSSSKNLKFSEKFEVVTDKKTKSKDIRNSIIVDAKKTGKYTITIKETYNKKTRTVGSFKIIVDESKYNNILTIAQGESKDIDDLFDTEGTEIITFIGLERKYEGEGFKLTESGHVVKMESAVDEYEGQQIKKITAKKPGMAVINEYTYNPKTKKKGNLIGRYLIEVTEPINIEEKTLYLSEKTRDTYVGDKYSDSLTWKVRANPLGTTIPVDKMTITSSDETVLKLKMNAIGAQLLPIKAGTATITVSYGKLSDTCKVTVYKNKEALIDAKNWIGKTFKINLNDSKSMSTELVTLEDSFYLEGDGFDILDKNSIVYTDSNISYPYSIYAANKGTAKINVYEYNNETKTKGNLIGSFFVEVNEPAELTAEEIVLSKNSIETYMGVNPNGEHKLLINNSNYFQWAVFPPFEEWDPFAKDPETEISYEMWGNFVGSKKLREKTSITISDPEILSLKETISSGDDEGHLLIIPKKAGKTTITFKCDNASVSCDVIIYANKAEYEKAVENRLK